MRRGWNFDPTAGKACSKVARAWVVVDGDGPAVGVVFHRDALPAHAGFFDHAVGRVVLKAEVLAVFVDEGGQAQGGVIGQPDLSAFGILPGCGLRVGVVGKVDGTAECIVGLHQAAGRVISKSFV